MTIEWEDDNRDQVLAYLRGVEERAVGDAAEFLLGEANRTVPLDEDPLSVSGTVSQDGTTAAISYDTPYAARQHEDLDLHHPGGRRAKWLELTMQEQAAVVAGFLAESMRAGIG